MFKRSRNSFSFGIFISLFGHLLGAGAIILTLEAAAAKAARAPEVFTVTLEGGAVLGGVSQAPKEEGQKKVLTKADLKKDEPTKIPEEKEEPEESEAELEKELELNAEKLKEQAILEEKKKVEIKKRNEAEKKRTLEAKKKAELEKKKLKQEKRQKELEKEKQRKKEKAEKKRKQKAAAVKKRRQEKKARESRLKDAAERAKNLYSGESARAGGKDFGAARLGGNGMGGGTLRSAEFIAYSNAIHDHVKSRWNWGTPTTRVLRTKVSMNLLPNGDVQNARIVTSSGNGSFDQSILRAVRKSSPLPAPPSRLYSQFKEVRIIFDSVQR